MEIKLTIDATPAAVACAESWGLLGAGLKALAKIQLKEPQSRSEPAPVADKPPFPFDLPEEEYAPEAPAPAPEQAPTAEEPAPEPTRQAAAGRREARQISGEEPAPQGGAAASPAELHTHADILTICAALKRDYPEDFTPAAGLQFTRDACKAAGVDSIKPTDPEAVERLYQAVANMAADFRASQGGVANDEACPPFA